MKGSAELLLRPGGEGGAKFFNLKWKLANIQTMANQTITRLQEGTDNI